MRLAAVALVFASLVCCRDVFDIDVPDGVEYLAVVHLSHGGEPYSVERRPIPSSNFHREFSPVEEDDLLLVGFSLALAASKPHPESQLSLNAYECFMPTAPSIWAYEMHIIDANVEGRELGRGPRMYWIGCM